MSQTPFDPADLIARAFEYGIPAFETARLAYGFSYDPGNPRRVPVNTFAHRRTLADHRHRMMTTPNNDTLYSSGVIDLSAGPVRLTLPHFGARYYSVALLDAYTNAFAYIGTRTAGGDGGSHVIAGPDWQGGVSPVIRSPSNHISAHIRILVDGVSDYPAAHALQDGCRLLGPSPLRPDLIRPVAGDAENFVAVVNQVLRDDPPPAADAPTLQELRQAGIGMPALTSQQRQWWNGHFGAARAGLIAASKEIGSRIDGWQYLPDNIGDFGTDYRTRARIAISGVVANVAAESIYTIATTDGEGAPLRENHRYRLRLPAGTPPADAFWSLSIYEVMPDGAMFFGDNALHRYAIGNRTRGLAYGGDGSLDILIQTEKPEQAANWLPVPAPKFALVMRAYLPRPALLTGQFRYPAIARVG